MNEDSIFAGALQRAAPEERAAYLDGACAGDPALRARVEALLAVHDKPDSLFDEPLVPRPPTTVDRPTDLERPGAQLGRYKLLEEIGEGGFGVVFLAEQQQPIRRRVALKVIKPGMDTRAVVARFEAERQALALMDHPNIAKVLDAGTTGEVRGQRSEVRDENSPLPPTSDLRPLTSSSRPFFVMELVHGIRITQFCDEQQLTPKERIELFVPVCQAIQHAHQKGIIHRDIKPSNILVSLYDGRPVPKVIDFGVAKAIGERLTEKTLFTQFGQVVGTLEYMSPEQAEMNQLDVDTRADVYSLGAVLYELLTGSPPFEPNRLRTAAFDEILRIIREEEPPRPSLRLSSGEKLAAVSAQRKTEPAALSRLMHGELDWIVMKALDKQRSRRYETASGLAKDIERYLSEEPVEAGPPSASYRLRKLAYRYRRPLTVAAAFSAILAVTAVFSSVQWVRATNSAIAAREAEEQAIKDRDEKEKQRIRAVEAEHAATQQQRRAEASAAEARRNLYTAHMQQIQLEWDRSNLARVRELLARYAHPATEKDDLRGWEWRYWTRMCEQDLRTLKGHEGAVNAVAFNSDGSLAASAGRDGKVCLWNVGDGALVREIKAHEGAATCVAFHGSTIASGGSDRTLRLWNASDGQKITEFRYGNIVACVAFSSDGKLLAVGCTSGGPRPVPGRPVERRIIDVAASKELHRLDAERDAYDLALTKDGSQLVIAATPNLEFWNARTGELLKQVAVDKVLDNDLQFEYTSALALSRANGFLVTASRNQLVRTRRFSDAEPTTTYRGHTGALTTVALSPDERTIASAGGDNAIILWDIETGNEIRRLRGHEKGVTCVRFSLDGLRLASASNDGAVKIWDAVEPTDFRPFLTGTRGHHKAEAFSHDGRLYAVSHFSGSPAGSPTRPDNTFFQWVEVRDALSGRRAFEAAGHHGWIDALAFSHDGSKLATGARDRTVKIYDVAAQRELHTLGGLTHWWIGGLTFSPDGRWLRIETPDVDPRTGQAPFTQQVWNASTGQRAASFPATGFAFHPRENICVVASSKDDQHALDFYRLDQQLVDQAPFQSWKLEAPAQGLTYDPQGIRLAALVANRLFVWGAASGAVETSIPGAADLNEYESFLGFDERGERLFTRSGSRKLSVWRTDTGDLMCEATLPQQGAFMGARMSPNGSRIAARNLRFNHLLELGPLDDETRDQLEARNLAANLLKFPTQLAPYITKTKAELLRDVSHLATISENVRKATAELIDDVYTAEEEATQFGSHGVDLILAPGKSRTQYEEGLMWTKRAVEIDAEQWEFEYGFALYRLQRYREALIAIENSQAGEMKRDVRAVPAVLAVRAMAQFQLGMKESAVEALAKAKADEWAALPENLELVREARALIEPDNRGEEDMAAGTTFARGGQWEDAIAAFARAEKQLAGKLRADCLYYLAFAQFGAGDREAHRRACNQLAAEFDIASDAYAAGRLAYASVVTADALDDWSTLARAIEKHQFEYRIRGALEIRAGNYDDAIRLFPEDRTNLRRSWDLAFIAMAEHLAGHTEQARQTLAACEKILDDEAAGRIYVPDWTGLLSRRSLVAEAKQLINGSAP